MKYLNLLIAIAVLAIGCDPVGPVESGTSKSTSYENTCAENNPNINPDVNNNYDILNPTEGETYKVGDTLYVCLCSFDTTLFGFSEEVLVLNVVVDGFAVSFPGKRDGNRKYWVIAESVSAFTETMTDTTISTISDNVQLKLESYDGVSNTVITGKFSIAK